MMVVVVADDDEEDDEDDDDDGFKLFFKWVYLLYSRCFLINALQCIVCTE